VRKRMVGTHSPCSVFQAIVGAQREEPRTGAQHPAIPGKRMVGAQAHGRWASPWSVPRPEAPGAPGHRPYPRTPSGRTAYCRYPGAWPVPQAHGQYSRPWSVLTPHSRCSGLWSVPRQQNRGQAPSTTLDSAQQARAGDGAQAPLVPRSTCAPRLKRGVRCSRMFQAYG